MKRALVVGVAVGCAACFANAGQLTVLGGGNQPFNYGDGGEFRVTGTGYIGLTGQYSDGPAGTFQTFCIETSEPLRFGSTYDAAMNTAAEFNGTGSTTMTSNPLDAETAYLYYSFRKGTLAGYDYAAGAGGLDADPTTNGREESAGALQLALWYLEGQIATLGDFGDPVGIQTLAQQFIDDANSSGWTDIGKVRILNLTLTDATGAITYYQDVLTIVPLPQTAGLAGLGLGMVAIRRRRAV